MDAQVSAELAGKVLAAETRNAIKAVSDGGTLPTTHRKQMQNALLTPEIASKIRADSLLEKYTAGHDLSPAQWEEIRTAHPGFALQPAPPSVIAEKESFVLEQAAPSSTKLTKADEAKYVALYKKSWRQIRRWVEKGIASGIPCPLHDPRALANWWPGHFKWRVDPVIEEAARNTAAAPTVMALTDPANAAAIPPKSPAIGTGPMIDLESFDPEEGDRLRELKQIQAAKFHQFKEALRLGHDSAALESKYIKLCETIDKIETRVTERLKKRGLFILRAEVERDLAAAAELFRQSGESMKRRIMELCPSLDPTQRAQVSTSVDSVLTSQARVFSRLDSLTPNDLLRELAA